MCKYAFPRVGGTDSAGWQLYPVRSIVLTAVVYCLNRTMKADEGMNNHGAAAAHQQ